MNTAQLLSDAGFNPFAVKLVTEDFDKIPDEYWKNHNGEVTFSCYGYTFTIRKNNPKRSEEKISCSTQNSELQLGASELVPERKPKILFRE
ncbi:MAG: hypothetical protein GY862_06770 [Gammaproteobacteria bacterium]|nr:hypothetical protein [Gammaproteobacteria bacterium]